jgi:hypothetical protein
VNFTCPPDRLVGFFCISFREHGLDRPAAAAPPSPAKPAVPIPEPASGDPYIERLERLESLRQKGLISDEEYRQLRARIFEKL